MTQNEVLAILHKVVAENQQYTTWTVSTPHLVMLVNNAVQAEREACAALCFDIWNKWLDSPEEDRHKMLYDAEDCAAAIRARGQA